jgi:hypothetical protein
MISARSNNRPPTLRFEFDPPPFSIRDLRIDVNARYYVSVKAVFVELPPFERHRADYLDDDAFLRLQRLLMLDPELAI